MAGISTYFATSTVKQEWRNRQHTYLGFGHFLLFLGKSRYVYVTAELEQMEKSRADEETPSDFQCPELAA